MITLETTALESIINDSLEKAISYEAYRTLVSDLVEQKSTSGNDKTEALANYTMLNDRRMKRWDKTVKISEEAQNRIANFDGKVTWLVITESWCGDAAHVIPVLNKIAALNTNINLKLVFRDENEFLMDQFLTNGGRAIAKLIMIDDATGNVVNTYGPRPSEATAMVNAYKAEHGKLTPEFKEDLQGWYNKNKGQNILSDVLGMLNV
ncbi:thioredoxin family protein [Psychroserpens sp.]|uniref:thioredoxin family protein n=1 Tax=Psychroserpens sp. TaxID=2020870 RepID=UPI001AFE99EF|nr:thioredoxin family protein [Psychroserpens sp.]MBO6605625.1 thioredoxin family protein [Psychroserpens sp.]MBO6631172.1 thioredoxin family protein [Psychroserpens sp.]MBO6653566.1 thioredoxin family protein [Psychroserpens sp.]MBO6681887.1 thioredoxin family protein [Psychroserpens sp.]MBO6748999.1 thioredoxin family protein [Psychroserpens sp.]